MADKPQANIVYAFGVINTAERGKLVAARLRAAAYCVSDATAKLDGYQSAFSTTSVKAKGGQSYPQRVSVYGFWGNF